MSNESRMTEVTSSQREPGREQRVMTFRATQLIWLLFGALEVLIALRIGLKLIDANVGSPIVAVIYGFTTLFLFPFTSLIGSPELGGMVLELSSMFAMLVYALLAWAVTRTISLIFYSPPGSMVDVTETTTHDRRSIQ